MKKILALVIAMMMMMASVAFAASIKITTDETFNDDSTANVYKAYKIFDAQYTSLAGTNTQDDKDPTYTPDDANVAYFMATGNPWISTVQGMTDYFTVTAAADGSGYTVVLKDGVAATAATAEAIAGVLKSALATVNPSGDYAGKTVTAGGSAVTVDPGYYLIVSDTATNLALVTTDVEIIEKNEYIVDGKVAETASVTVGESATYYVKVYIPSNVDKTVPVVVHDKMDSVLKFNNDAKVYVGDTDPGSTVEIYKGLTYGNLTSAYSVNTEPTDDCSFEISITTTELAGKYLVFKYSAELTSAALKDTGYVNEEYSSYGDYKTTPDKPEVKTYDFEFTKVDGDGAKLDGAEFQLYAAWDTTNNKPSGDPIAMIADGTNYKKADTDDTGTVTTMTVDSAESGAATNISGLGGTAEGTNYYLVETKAPVGFNQLTDPIIVNIKDDGTITVSLAGETLSSASDAFNVENNSGTVLPSTGGIGTTIFYVIGALLFVGAGVLLVAKRRAK